jgi:hypothetical protein
LEGLGKDDVDSGYRPHEHQAEGPEADGAVQVPIDSLPTCARIDGEIAPPTAHAGPPHYCAGQAENREKHCTDAVDDAACVFSQKVNVQIAEPGGPQDDWGNSVA